MSDFALPQSLSISDIRRNAMPAVRRTVIHGSTSQNIYGPGELIYIPVDTGAAGSFFDVETSRLDFTVNVYNKNYFVDFFNLPRCGFHALIEEFGLEIHNSLHDNQRFYAEMIELEMIRRGENMVPYELTVSNPYEPGGGVAGEMHINLIKPSMVSTAGLPHGVRYDSMAQPAGSNVSSSVANTISEGILLNSHPYLKKPLGRNGYGTIADVTLFNSTAKVDELKSGGYVGQTGSVLNNSFSWWSETNLPCTSHYDDRIIAAKYVPMKLNNNSNTIPSASTDTDNRIYTELTDANSYTVNSGSSYGYDNQIFTTSRFHGSAAGGADIIRYSKVYPRTDEFGSTYSDNTMFDVHYGQTLGGYTPMMWPAKQPCDLEKLFAQLKEARKGVNTKNVHHYYANCKNISCAIPVNLTGDPYGETALWGSSSHTLPSMSDSTRGEKYSFRVSLKVYSCLIGVYARKWFPSLLIGAGRMRIRLRLQQPNVAFQTLMDPCRVVPHTARDRFPYLGVHTSGGKAISALIEAALSSVSHAVHPILISNYVAGSCFNDMVATGKYPVPQQKMKALSYPFSVYSTAHRRAQGLIQNTKSTQYDAVPSQSTTYGSNDFGKPTEFDLTTIPLTPTHLLPTDHKDDHSYKHYGARSLVNRAGTSSIVNSTDWVANSLAERFEGVYKVMSDVLWELSNNQLYGYTPQFLDHTTSSSVDFWKVSNGSITSDTGSADVNTKQSVGNYATPNPTDANPIYGFQNYYWWTDTRAMFSDHARSGGYTSGTPGANHNYSAGSTGTSQVIWHPRQNGSTALPNDMKVKGLNWEIFNYPLPQYAPLKEPWKKSDTRVLTTDDFVNENAMCYGTFLRRSVAQVRRTNKNLFSLSMDYDHSTGITERLTYTVSNVSYRVEEIILPESASMQIIASAMEGGITMEADSVKSIEQICQRQDNQKILLNVAAGIVNDISFVFQPTEMLQGDKAYGYNSFAFYCPWTSFKFIQQTTGTKTSAGTTVNNPPNSPEDYNYLGGEPNYYNSLLRGENIGINTFLSISTEYFPRNPIDDLQTLLDHVTWGDQRRGDIEYLGLDPLAHNTFDSSNFQTILPFQDGFFSVFTPIECLDDQTITNNPFWTPLECNLKSLVRGKRAQKPALPYFKPFDGTFHLSFNLQAFMFQQDRMNTGIPMVNNNSYLQMQQCHLLREFETRMLTFIRCFARVVIERGGIIQIFT